MEGKRILAVDDDPVSLVYIEELLSSEGYEVTTATSGEEALRDLRGNVPDLLLLDVQMPGMGGFDVLSNLRQRAETAQLPVIFLTVRDAPGDEARGLKEHVVDYISKDVLTPDRAAILLYRIRNFFSWQENERLRGMLATIVSTNHEINNPLMVVMGNAEMLRIRYLGKEASADAKAAVSRIIDGCRKAKEVLERISAMAMDSKWNVKPYSKGVEMLDLTGNGNGVEGRPETQVESRA